MKIWKEGEINIHHAVNSDFIYYSTYYIKLVSTPIDIFPSVTSITFVPDDDGWMWVSEHRG